MKILKQLQEIVPPKNLFLDHSLAKHNTFRIGGPADAFVNVTDVETLSAVMKLCIEEDIEYCVLGNGSNVLIGDKGYRGVILYIGKGMSDVSVEGNKIRAGAGAMLGKVAQMALKEELTGFEFAAGIPGAMGGSCVMNAGAYGGEISDVLESVTVLDKNGTIKEIKAADLEMGYRKSNIAKNRFIIIETVIKLEKGNKEKIKAAMDEYKEARTSKQPLNYPNAGSAFKRPEGYYAGKLVDDSGMRGYSVGGAQVSEKHCGFVINTGEATAAEVRQLLEDVAAKVWELFEVKMESEIQFIGEF